MLSDAPPSREAVTTSRTWAESVDVNTFTNSGITTPAIVPQVITVDNFHHRLESPPKSGISRYDTKYVAATDTSEVNQTSVVSGASKFIFDTFWYFAFAIVSLAKYDKPDAITIMMRITKIHTSSWTFTSGSFTASRMKEINATPVTP